MTGLERIPDKVIVLREEVPDIQFIVGGLTHREVGVCDVLVLAKAVQHLHLQNVILDLSHPGRSKNSTIQNFNRSNSIFKVVN